MRHFQVTAPDGRLIQHEAESHAALKALITADGYEITGELLDGLLVEPLPDGLKHYSYLTHLLTRHREEMVEFLDGLRPLRKKE